MIDSFVLLTPLLMLGVLALVRFVGCNQVFGLEETTSYAPPITNLQAIAGDQKVTLTWDYEPGNATSFEVWYHDENSQTYVVYAGAAIDIRTTQGQAQHGSTAVTDLTNGIAYSFKIIAYTADSSSSLDGTLEKSATPGITDFITNVMTPGMERNNFTGWVGMAVQMNADLIVTQLGRFVVANNTRAHDVRIVDPGQANAVRWTVTIQMPGGPIGTFVYALLPQPVVLQAFHLYYFMSHEELNGDRFHDIMTVDTTMAGTIISGVYSDDAMPDTYLFLGSMKQTYGPVNFRY